MLNLSVISNSAGIFINSDGFTISPIEAIKFAEEIILVAQKFALERLMAIEKEKDDLILAAYYDPAESLMSEQV